MKIALFTTHIDTGGVGLYTVNLAKYLARGKEDVVVVSSGGDLEKTLSAEGIRHEKIDVRTKADIGIKVWRAVKPFSEFVKREKIDIVHAQTRVAQVIACLSRKSTKVPYVTTCHGFYKFRRLGRRLFPCWGDRVIAISRNVKEHLVSDFGVPEERTRLVYNGIDVERFGGRAGRKSRDLICAIGLEPGILTIGSVGRFVPVKGYKYLLFAFKELLNDHPDLQLLLVGKGPEGERLSDLAGDLGIRDRVYFDDGRKAPLEEYLSAIDVFCLPSIEEGFGLALVEAMASGCACVASDVGGLSELIEPGKDGMLVPPGDPDGIADALKRLVEDPKMREIFTSNGKVKAVRDFTLEKTVEGTLSVYREVVGGV